LLNTVVASGWTAAKLDYASHKFEICYGSEILILAAEQRLLSLEACLERISLSSYLSLIQKLGISPCRRKPCGFSHNQGRWTSG